MSEESVAQADAVLAAAEDLARTVLALKKPRSTVTPVQRKRIGDRDGWICRICAQQVDPNLKWQQPNVAAIPEYEAYLAHASAPEEAALLAWAGDSVEKAEAILAWSCSQTWREWKAGARRPRGFERKEWTKGFVPALRKVIGQRALNNNEVGTVEHLIPVAVGGGNDEANLVIAHKRCNTHFGAAGATNAELLAAPWSAREFLADLERLRDAREITPERMTQCVNQLVEAAGLLGLADCGVVEAEVATALAAYATPYQPLWDARRECIERVRALSYASLDTWDLKREITTIDARIKTLKRAAAIERWEQKRAATAAKIAKLQADRESMRETLDELSGLSGHAHDAAWWLARRDEFPGVPPGEGHAWWEYQSDSGC